MDTAEGERLRRWRLVLGEEAQASFGLAGLSPEDRQMDEALAAPDWSFGEGARPAGRQRSLVAARGPLARGHPAFFPVFRGASHAK